MAAQKNPPWNAPFAAQLDFLKQKLQLPSAVWDDIWNQAHDRAIIVAGAQTADLVSDLHKSLLRRATDGKGLNAFQFDYDAIVKQHGWQGGTGSDSEAGSAWRARVIWNTNMATSYAAGRYQQMDDPGLKKILPYLQYKHSDAAIHPRQEHKSWDGLTLPADHPFWLEHKPPNGWFCGCYIVPVTIAAFMAATAKGRGVAAAPAPGNRDGIDPGFAYAPGANVKTPLTRMIEDKVFNLEAPIGAAMWVRLKPVVQDESRRALAGAVDQLAAGQPGAGRAFAHVLAPWLVRSIGLKGIQLTSAGIQLDITSLAKALEKSPTTPGGLALNDWRKLPDTLDNAKTYLRAKDGSLVYALPEGGLAVKLDQAGQNVIDIADDLISLDDLAGDDFTLLET